MNHDETEYEIQRKGRSQTEGLGLFADAEGVSEVQREVMMELGTVGNWTHLLDRRSSETSHPDSVAGNSQNGRILKHLQEVGPLTSLDALTLFGCSRLAARIADLKNKGYAIRSRMVDLPNGKRVSEYSMVLDK